MVEVVADCLERDCHEKFHHLVLGVSDGEEGIDRLRACMTALGNKFPNEGNHRVRLLIARGFAGPDGGNGLSRDLEEGLGNRAVSSDAVAAFVFQARGEQGESALLRGERGFAPFSVQRQVAFQHFGRIGKDAHQVRNEAERLLDAFQGRLGAGRRVGDGQGLEEGCGGAHIILLGWLFFFYDLLVTSITGVGRRLTVIFDVSNVAPPHGLTSGQLPRADES